jgi:hypothetical protein
LGFGSTAAQVQSLKPLVRGRIALRVPEILIAAEDRRAICRSAARACAPNATILVAASPLPSTRLDSTVNAANASITVPIDPEALAFFLLLDPPPLALAFLSRVLSEVDLCDAFFEQGLV